MVNVVRLPTRVNRDKHIWFVYISASVFPTLRAMPVSECLLLLWLTAYTRRVHVRKDSHQTRIAAGKRATRKITRRVLSTGKAVDPQTLKSAARNAYHSVQRKKYATVRAERLKWPGLNSMLAEQGLAVKTASRARLRETLKRLRKNGFLEYLDISNGHVELQLSQEWLSIQGNERYIPVPYPLRLSNPLTIGMAMWAANLAWFRVWGPTITDPVQHCFELGNPGSRVVGRPKNAVILLQGAIKELASIWPHEAIRMTKEKEGYKFSANFSVRDRHTKIRHFTKFKNNVPMDDETHGYDDAYRDQPVIKKTR